MAKTLVKAYKKRFRIENSYRHTKVVKIRTSTRKIYLRLLFWVISALMALLWEILNHTIAKLGLDNYLLRQREVNRLIYAHIKNKLFSQTFIYKNSLSSHQEVFQ